MFEGLLEEPHNSAVVLLLFTFAEWHSLAKLRMHTQESLGWLRQSTRELGRLLRQFQAHTCSFFDTVELPAEEAARGRRQTKQAATKRQTTSAAAPKTRKKVIFNLIMYKLHALGYYVPMTMRFGTTDSYSTQTVGNS